MKWSIIFWVYFWRLIADLTSSNIEFCKTCSTFKELSFTFKSKIILLDIWLLDFIDVQQPKLPAYAGLFRFQVCFDFYDNLLLHVQNPTDLTWDIRGKMQDIFDHSHIADTSRDILEINFIFLRFIEVWTAWTQWVMCKVSDAQRPIAFILRWTSEKWNSALIFTFCFSIVFVHYLLSFDINLGK